MSIDASYKRAALQFWVHRATAYEWSLSEARLVKLYNTVTRYFTFYTFYTKLLTFIIGS